MNIGYLYAIVTILLFGSWPVPTKTLKIDPRVQAFFLTLGMVATGIVIFIISGMQSAPLALQVLPFFAGILWSIGITLGFIGIKELGITRALGIWIPVNIIVGSLWGLLYFQEAKKLPADKLFLSLLGIGLLIAAALAIISSIKTQKVSGNTKLGILCSVGLGLFHGSVLVPLNASSLPFSVTLLPFTMGMVVFTSALALVKKLNLRKDPISISRMISGGLILGTGNLAALLTIKSLGYANGFALTQLAIIINTLWGILVFKEVSSIRGKILICIGIIIALIGALILNSARVL